MKINNKKNNKSSYNISNSKENVIAINDSDSKKNPKIISSKKTKGNKINLNDKIENNENDLQSKDAVLNKNRNIGNSDNMNIRNAERKFLNEIKVQGLLQIKLFLVLAYSWVSKETQKLYGLIIFLPFLEIFNYLSNDYHSKLNDTIYKNKIFNLEEVRSEDSSNTNVNNDQIQNEEKKNKKQHNYYLFYFFFYITI